MSERRAAKPGPMASRLRRCAALVAACVSAGAMLAMVPALHAAADEPGLHPAGFLPRPSLTSYGANGNILIDHRAGRLYQASVFDDTTVGEFDLASLKRLRTIRMPQLQPVLTDKGPTDWVWSLDSAHRRLFAIRAEMRDESVYQTFALAVADLRSGSTSVVRGLWPLGERIPLALSYDERADRLYLLTQVKADPAGRSVFFLEERRPDGSLVWEHREDACYAARDNQYGPSLWRSAIQRDRLYFTCYNATAVQAQVVRVHLGSAGWESEETFPAVPGGLSTMYDPGSDRLFFLTTNSGAGRGAWVFDGVRSSFLGVIASGDNRVGATDYAMGVDPVRGRLYLQTPAGLLVADARRTPLPSGLLFREYAGPGVGLIQVDPARHRVFVPDPKSLSDTGQATRYAIFRDTIPSSSDPPAGDPDEFTLDVAEKAGRTAASWSGAGSAFAARVLQTGGVQRNAWNAALGQFPPDDPTSPLFLGAWQVLASLPVDAGNREVSLGRVHSVSRTNDSADARARGIDTDAGTERDAAQARPGKPWPVPVTECHDAGGAATSKQGRAATATVACDAGKRSATATAGIPGLEVPGGVRIAAGWATSAASVDKRGLVTHSVAMLAGVQILDRVWIGALSTQAETWARGRPGTAGGRYVRTITDARIDADADGTPEYTCSVCDGATVARLANSALAGVALMELPEPDPLWYPHGSKGGYQSIVRKERFRSYAEHALNDDDTDEIPAIQVIVFSDGRAGRTRQIVQLAGVQAESHYGIYLLPDAGGTAPEPEPTTITTIRPSPAPAPGPVAT
ncbi:MAG: hypothetical protein ACRDJM_05365, partial [Actinomycetota bacterium]